MRKVWLLVLASCAPVTDARRAQDPTTAVPGERTVRASEVGLGQDTRLQLDRAVEIALQCHPSIAQARFRAEAAEARVKSAVSGYLPEISVSASLDGSWTEDTSTESHRESLGITQLLFDFGKTPALIRQATEEHLAALSDVREAEVEAAFNVRKFFYGVLQQIELVRVAEETVRQFQKRLEQVEGFVQVGSRVRYDLTKAQVDLGNAQLTLVRARTQLSVQRAFLNQALGLAEEPNYALDRPAAGEAWTMRLDEVFAEARRSHPRLAAQELREKAASHALDAAVADFWPRISIDSALSFSGSLSPVDWAVSLGGLLRWVIFSGGSQSAQVYAAIANLRGTRASKALLEQQIFLELRQAYAQWEDARERLTIVNLTVQQAEENLTLAQGRYEIGRASSVDLTDAQVALSNARADQVQALYDVDIAVASLKRSMGALK